MWENLPSHLRTGLAVAFLAVIGVAAASFYLSFLALREVAANPVTGWGEHAWVFPLCVDAALIAAEVTYISVSMIRGINRALPLFMVVLFGAVTVWFNVERVPAEWRVVTALPPVAGIFMTLLIAFLLKVFARVTGKAMTFDAPPPAVGTVGALQATAVRLPDGSYGVPGSSFAGYGAGTFPPSGAFGHLPSASPPGNGHIGQRELDEASLRAAVEMYLSGLTPEGLGVATGSSIVAALSVQGIAVDERYARRILEEYKADHTPTRKGRRR
jgi:hypothetical protein